MLYRISKWEDIAKFELWAEIQNISFEKLDEGNYLDYCPNCGEYEIWHGGHCSRCGYEI